MVPKGKKDTVEIGEGLSRQVDRQPAEVGQRQTADPGKVEPMEELMAKLQESEAKAAENYDRYVRVAAELDNYRKRAARDKADAIQYGNENLLRDILPLVDGMDRALEHACNSEDFDAFRKGLKLLQGQLLGCLQKHGVEMIETAGKHFDPHIHEAMMQVESAEHEDSHVVGEFERGYLLNGRLLRPAKVSVCKRPSPGGDRGNNCEEAKNN
jgi:molecular chaperone GrpE